ncbi:hypothetical protein [Streptomyces sp. NBC_00829]|uniref:hypothetical protein n=1 Tax=Streptomyces sp. NBC_00829 TaxID=2903679 RepID=UPI00386F24B1|nr:hypothetical protein OG293_23280 [Streptomyces sp. NBC_00829]
MPDCPHCDATQQFANKLGDESYRVDAARQHLAVALIFLLEDLHAGTASGETHVEIPRIVKVLERIQRRTRHAMNAPLPHSRRASDPTLPRTPEPDRSPETIALILRIVEGKCEELARIEPPGSHSKRALSDLALLAEGWITPESLGFSLAEG